MLKFELNLILIFVSYEVIMLKNIFLDHSSPFCSYRKKERQRNWRNEFLVFFH